MKASIEFSVTISSDGSGEYRIPSEGYWIYFDKISNDLKDVLGKGRKVKHGIKYNVMSDNETLRIENVEIDKNDCLVIV